uniref:RRM domain-containing protein n=1 Tax=Leersia perrieri TaxID=77586 RepID=A0A0D9VJS3_9ORYZ
MSHLKHQNKISWSSFPFPVSSYMLKCKAMLFSGDERSQFAYITFQDDQGAERAMLLTGATIVDMAVIITPATNYQLPAAVLADLESKNSGGVESALRKAEDAVGSMLAKGFVLGKDALEKAKAFDEKLQLTSTATAKVSSLDRKMGLSQKFSTGTSVVNEKMKEMDQKYQVAEKTKTALAAAEQTVSTAGSAIMSKQELENQESEIPMAHSQENVEIAEKENKHQEAELPKTDLPGSFLMSEQNEHEQKHPDSQLSKTHIPGSPVTIPVGAAATDGNPSNTPKKPEHAQGFI